MALWSRRKLFGGLGGAAAVAAVSQIPARGAAAATPGATIQLVTPPERIADTRTEGTGKVSAAHPLDMFVGGLIGDGVVGALLNITITETEGSGFLVLRPSDLSGEVPFPPTSNINWWTSGITIGNAALVGVGGENAIEVACRGAGRTHFIIDLQGYVPFVP